MNKKRYSYISVSILSIIFSSIMIASSGSKNMMEPLNSYQIEDLEKINIYLLDNLILHKLRIRQKLLMMSCESISGLDAMIDRKTSSRWQKENRAITGLIKEIKLEKESESIYTLNEEIFIDNIPKEYESPFYKNTEYNIRKITPKAERLYFDNIKLNFKSNNLEKADDFYWVSKDYREDEKYSGERAVKAPIAKYVFADLNKKTNKMWNHEMPGSNLYNSVYQPIASDRQWLKVYSENAVIPLKYQDIILIRNEYRIFGLDMETGSRIMDFALNESGSEYYHTIRHTHRNSFGSEMLLNDDVIYTELNGRFAAVKIGRQYVPALQWETGLGEYTVCTKPVVCQGYVITGLINARGELWIAGFNRDNGILRWSTYIGLTSFLSPVCPLSAVTGNKVIIGTNYGVIICIDPYSGGIIWLRKYSPKQYSLIDYFKSGKYKNKLNYYGNVEYDSQFLDMDGSGNLYYKPRESDHFYILNADDGSIVDDLLIDHNRYYLPKAFDGNIVLLEKKDEIVSGSLMVVNLDSGNTVYTHKIGTGSIKNVISTGRSELMLKVDNTLHFYNFEKDTAGHESLIMPEDDWLLGMYDGYLLTGEDKRLSCYPLFKRDIVLKNKINSASEKTNIWKNIRMSLEGAVKMSKDDRYAVGLNRVIIADIERSNMPIDLLADILIERHEVFKLKAWADFIRKTFNIYKDRMVRYKNVDIRFSNLLSGLGLRTTEIKGGKTEDENAYAVEEFQAAGPNITILPVKLIDGTQEPGFTLITNWDQVYCVDISGKILWLTRIFKFGGKEKVSKFPACQDDISCYLYKGTIIINDTVNVVGIKADSGRYLWSMTNRDEKDLSKFMQSVPVQKYNELLPPDYLFGGVFKKLPFDVRFITAFADNKLFILHDGDIYLIDPETGFCRKTAQLGRNDFSEMRISDKHIILFAEYPNDIVVLNDNLDIVKKYAPDFTENDMSLCPAVIDGKSIISITDRYLCFSENGKLKDKIFLDNSDESYIEKNGRDYMVIQPFSRVGSFHMENGRIKKNWEHEINSDNMGNFLSLRLKTKRYFITDKALMFPVKTDYDYTMRAIDLDTGGLLWEKPIIGTRGYFLFLSDYVRDENKIYFVLITALEHYNEARITGRLLDDWPIEIDNNKYWVNYYYKNDLTVSGRKGRDAKPHTVYFYRIYSKLMSLDIRTGDIEIIREDRNTSNYSMQKSAVAALKGAIIYSFNGDTVGVVKR